MPSSASEWFEAAAPQTVPPANWGEGVLQLTTVLMLSPRAEVRQKVAALLRGEPRMAGQALLAELQPLAAGMVQRVARCMAEALGCEPDELIRFCEPNAGALELQGRHAIKRRLDRVWGGRALASVEATKEFRLPWPGPHVGHAILLRGTGTIDGQPWLPHAMATLPYEAEARLQPGALILLHDPPLSRLLSTMMAAGLAIYELMGQGPADGNGVATPLGRMIVSENLLQLNRRRIRLTESEARVLRRLAQSPGQVVSRLELAELLEVHPRSLDHTFVHLRNKVGDGLIRTIYGAGYLLDIES